MNPRYAVSEHLESKRTRDQEYTDINRREMMDSRITEVDVLEERRESPDIVVLVAPETPLAVS
jgi:hypothetical protein